MKLGCEVYISLPEGELIPKLEDMGCHFLPTPVDRRGLNPNTDYKLMKRYEELLREIAPDIVITYTIKPNIYGGMACIKQNIPYCINITGLGTAFQKKGLLKKMVISMYKKACKRAKTVFFENQGNLDTFLECGIVTKEQTCLLHGAGIDLTEYPFVEYPQQGEETCFLFIGRVMKEKGVEELFTAMERLKAQYPVRLDVVGPYEENYKEKIRQLEAQGIIVYHGYQEDVRPFLANCHCFVLPSYHEGMANTLLEAGATGRPLITGCIHGCMEAVEEGKNGLFCQVGNAESLYWSMQQFLILTPEKHRQMGRESRRIMEEQFEKSKVVAATIEQLGV
jgi:galacturonosyltransferase